MSRDLVGVTLGRYHCVEFIGLGGMAEVYRAVDTELDRVVAIKVLHPFFVSEDGFPERFRREARTLATLQHPNVVHVFDSGLQDFNSYVVMEYVPGRTLKDRLRELNVRHEHMPISEVRRIFDALFAALGYAHRANVVHRDLKLTNVILADDGRVVLTDFGLAKIVGSTLHTASMAMIGTPAYMAPEQAQAGTVDPRSDIYSLGVILFELLTGRLPFEADTPFAMIAKHTQESPPRVSSLRRDLPRGLDSVLLKATAKEPAERFQSIEQFADALNAAFEGRRIPFVWTRPRLSRAARNWLALAVAVIVFLGVAAAQGWFSAAPPLATPTLTPAPTATSALLRALITGLTDLFERPDRSSRVIAQLEAGTEVALLDQQGMWLQVRTLNSGLVGWVDSNVVFFLPTDTPLPTLADTPPPGASLTPTPTPSATPRPSATATSSATPDAQSPSSTPAAPPSTPIPTATTAPATAAPTRTPTPLPPTATWTKTPAPSQTPTPLPPTATATPASSATPSVTPFRTLPPLPTPTAKSPGSG